MLCLDRDPVAIAEAKARLGADSRVALFLAPFSALGACADAVEPRLQLDGILFDLGVSSPQLDDADRGFSFMQDGPLDMRMSRDGISAADVVNGASADELVRIFREYGEERFAGRIARAIVTDREKRPFTRTLELRLPPRAWDCGSFRRRSVRARATRRRRHRFAAGLSARHRAGRRRG